MHDGVAPNISFVQQNKKTIGNVKLRMWMKMEQSKGRTAPPPIADGKLPDFSFKPSIRSMLARHYFTRGSTNGLSHNCSEVHTSLPFSRHACSPLVSGGDRSGRQIEGFRGQPETSPTPAADPADPTSPSTAAATGASNTPPRWQCADYRGTRRRQPGTSRRLGAGRRDRGRRYQPSVFRVTSG